MVGSAEVSSEHPLGKCITKFAMKQNAIISTVTKFKAISGIPILTIVKKKILSFLFLSSFLSQLPILIWKGWGYNVSMKAINYI